MKAGDITAAACGARPRRMVASALALACIAGASAALADGALGSARGAESPVVTASTLPPSLPVRREAAPLWATGGIGVLGALCVVLVVAGAVAWLLRRGGAASRGTGTAAFLGRWPFGLGPSAAKRPQDDIRLVRSLRLTPRASVHVVEWDGRQWLVGAADHGISLLGDRGCRLAPAGEAPPDGSVPREAS